ncbi:hypothetical protein Tco_1054214, partial [Tanacetum coccineum]
SSGDKDSLGDDASKQGRIDIGDINIDVEITLIDETQRRINDIIADEDITLIPKLILKLLKIVSHIVDLDLFKLAIVLQRLYRSNTRTYIGHEHKFVTKIVARRANKCIVSITEPDYKNLNKNDIEDMYLLIMNGVEKHRMLSIIYEPVHGIIYKNSKKEKRVMRHSEIHKFCDATLNRVLEGLKSYNNDVKYGYVQRELTNDEVEYLKLFEEEIEVRLKNRNQMRRWEMYVNGRPLGPRRERPE